MPLGLPRGHYRSPAYLEVRAALYARAEDLWRFASDHPRAKWLAVAAGCGVALPEWVDGSLVAGVVRHHCIEQGRPFPYRPKATRRRFVGGPVGPPGTPPSPGAGSPSSAGPP